MGHVLTLLTGLIAGAGHVLSGPDHLAAVAPLAVDQRAKTWRVGFMWGVGHSSGVWMLAVLAFLFREALPIENLSAWGERLVGLVLIAIGLLGFRRLLRGRVHSHVHEHDGVAHAHVHFHELAPDQHDHQTEHRHTHSALGIGTLHGLAGTAHLLGVLPALLLPTRLAAMIYVIAFGLGSILAMTVFSWVLGMLAGRFTQGGDRPFKIFLASCCSAAILVGAYWCYASFGTHAAA